MKIAVPSSASNLDGPVEQRLGSARCMLVIESDDMSFTSIDLPTRSGPGGGVEAVTAAVEAGAQAILTGFAAPHIVAVLKKRSVDVVTGCSGTVREAVAAYVRSRCTDAPGEPRQAATGAHPSWNEAVRKGMRQLYSMVPRLIGVVLLLGLFRGLVDEQTLLELLSGSTFPNALWGATLGSILVGNPVNSYVIGENLLGSGAGMAGSVALMMAWVTVGVIHFPLESSALGRRFALARNLSAFAVAILFGLVFAMLEGMLP